MGSALVALFLLVAAPDARAAELLMFEHPGCPWCARWHAEVGVAYPRTAEGKRAPLRRLDLSQAAGSGARLTAPVAVSPTFVLVDQGREIGRIVGYPGADFFWGLFSELVRRLPPDSG
jgi:hypothetical protein